MGEYNLTPLGRKAAEHLAKNEDIEIKHIGHAVGHHATKEEIKNALDKIQSAYEALNVEPSKIFWSLDVSKFDGQQVVTGHIIALKGNT